MNKFQNVSHLNTPTSYPVIVPPGYCGGLHDNITQLEELATRVTDVGVNCGATT